MQRRIVSLFTAEMKEEKKEKEDRKRNRRPKARQVLVNFGRWLLLVLLVGQNWLCVSAAAEGPQRRTEERMQQVARVKESRWVEEVPQRWKQPEGEDRTEMKKRQSC